MSDKPVVLDLGMDFLDLGKLMHIYLQPMTWQVLCYQDTEMHQADPQIDPHLLGGGHQVLRRLHLGFLGYCSMIHSVTTRH